MILEKLMIMEVGGILIFILVFIAFGGTRKRDSFAEVKKLDSEWATENGRYFDEAGAEEAEEPETDELSGERINELIRRCSAYDKYRFGACYVGAVLIYLRCRNCGDCYFSFDELCGHLKPHYAAIQLDTGLGFEDK